ncbi:MAG TPA: two-component regulator propeller domain-containing protein, partial [Longimicrobiales bacterium]|nr:two-component regulator propeller domain-containing protein [Longimicrobiales bacterium]
MRKICALHDGRVLAGLQDGRIVEVGEGSVDLESAISLPAPVMSIRCASSDVAFASTVQGVVYEVDLRNRSARVLARLATEGGGQVAVQDIARTWDGAIWVATDHGMSVIAPGVGPPRRITELGGARSVPSRDVVQLLVDDSGVLWLATWSGLASLHPLSATMHRIYSRSGEAAGLSGEGVISVEIDSDGEVWLGTDGGGIQTVDQGWRQGEAQIARPGSLSGLAGSVGYDLAFSPTGELWIAAYVDGIVRMGLNGEAAPVAVRSTEDQPLASVAYSVFIDRSGDVWAGDLALGLLRYDASAGVFRPFLPSERRSELGSDWIWPIVEDDAGILWVGAFNGGVASVDRERRAIRLYRAGPNGLSDDRILALFVGSNGVVWIGTEGGGLNRLDPATHEVSTYTVEDGLPHDNVQAIIADDLGYLWVSTSDGLARFDPETEAFLVFGEAAGLAGNRFFANSAAKGRSGELFFGGPDGLTIVDPSAVEPRDVPPRVALTLFRIHGREVPLSRALAEDGLDLEPNEN